MRNKVKGFTLIELIIVMATFSVIMFGALQLMDPVSKIMTTTANQESVSASADNIKRYLELNLRYAECVAINTSEPTLAQMINFIDQHYDGKLEKVTPASPSDPGVQYASGKLYVIKIDNLNGGKISKKVYPFTVGDTKNSAPGTGTSISNLAADGYLEEEWAVNKALYTDYHFNISLGRYDIDKTTRQLTSISSDLIARDNLSFTITAYPYDAAKDVDRQPLNTPADGDPPAAPFVYENGYVYSASMSLINATREGSFITYNWVGSPAAGYTVEKDDDGNMTFVTKDLADGGETFSMSPTSLENGAAEPDVIYIMYTYADGVE